MTDLSIDVCGIRYPNPFVLASGPPGTNGKVIQRSFELGWGGIVCKTLSLENDKVHNTVPRYGKLKNRVSKANGAGIETDGENVKVEKNTLDTIDGDGVQLDNGSGSMILFRNGNSSM